MINLSYALTDNPDLIYQLLDDIQKKLKVMLPFGAPNTEDFEPYTWIKPQDINNHKNATHISRFNRAKILVWHDLNNKSKVPYVDEFIKGMAVCTQINFFSLMILAKRYEFKAYLENIHSDEIHTYIVLKDSNNKKYILDLWANCALPHDNDTEWNEIMPKQYLRRKGAYRFSVNSLWSSKQLRSLWPQLECVDVLSEKEKYYNSIMSRVKSPTYYFFRNKKIVHMNLDEIRSALRQCR